MTKRPIARMALGAAAALLGLVIGPMLTASAASAAPAGGGAYTCTGGDVPSGTYLSMLITGVCYMPAGTIVVRQNLIVAPKALLDAVTPGDPTAPATPVVPATVLVGGNVYVGSGAVLLLGCSPNISCGSPPGISFDRIGGSLVATGAQGVVVHSASIGGNASVLGGGGGAAAETCNAQPAPTTPPTPPIANLEPWSEDPNLDQTPVYTDFEDSTIGGSLNITALTSCWLGSLRDFVGGSGTWAYNTMGDPDALEINNNLISGDMTCVSNSPAVQFGDGASAPNVVGGFGISQCGFNVVLPSPAPEAMQGPGISEHIAVSTRSLKTYYGTHKATFVDQAESVKTSSGYTITAVLNNFTLKGSGLTGYGTAVPSELPQPSGDAVLSTVYPDGSSSFIAYDSCDSCRFGGQTGTTTLRFYGTTRASGLTSGTFLVTFGGAVPPGELPTLVGWGTFTSAGQPAGTWSLVEHLGNASA
jgi:hypothetical protein